MPKIISPVSNTLPVADLERSRAFYRNVLGFNDALTNGPATIEFTQSAQPSAQTVFFEVDDVRGMRDDVVARGAAARGINRVNWIKMDMFEVRDPDGHVLWFGQSFHRAPIDMHTLPGKGDLRKIMPGMPHSNVPAGVAYYRDVLGFKVNYEQSDLAVMDRDSVRIILLSRRGNQGLGNCYMYVRDADALHAELLRKGARVQGEPVSHPWGLRDFRVLDLEDNELVFGQTFE